MTRRAKFGAIVSVMLLAAGAFVGLRWAGPKSAGTLAEIALRHQGDTAYEATKWNGWYRPGSNKCNKAVADWIVESGHPRPFVRGHFGLIPRDPSAHEWADPKIVIKGWSTPMPRAVAMPGAVAMPDDVISQEHGPVYGHVGIVAEQGSTVSAYGDVQPKGLVLKNDWGFRTGAGANGESGVDPAPTVRRYIGNR
jgi:hypothetical protein